MKIFVEVNKKEETSSNRLMLSNKFVNNPWIASLELDGDDLDEVNKVGGLLMCSITERFMEGVFAKVLTEFW